MEPKQIDGNLYSLPRLEISYERLRQLGFIAVFNFESGWRDILMHDDIEADVASIHDIEEIRIPCSNIVPPNRDQLNKFLRLAIRYVKKGKVLGHCFSSVDRDGVFTMAWRIKVNGWTFDKAYKEFVDNGRHIWFFWWKPILRKMFNEGEWYGPHGTKVSMPMELDNDQKTVHGIPSENL